MTIKHHLTDALLTGYAAGTLPEAFNLVVATHISLCDDCRAALAAHEAVGGAVLAEGESVAVDDGAFDAVIARVANIDAGPDETVGQRIAGPDETVGEVFPAPLRAYVNGDVDAVKWRRIGGGVSQAILPTSKAASVRLLRIPAGTAMPDHGHRGTELTLVLRGAFADDSDTFAAGDVEVADEHLTHTPVALAGEDCICLAASDAPLRFAGLLPRLAQRYFRI